MYPPSQVDDRSYEEATAPEAELPPPDAAASPSELPQGIVGDKHAQLPRERPG